MAATTRYSSSTCDKNLKMNLTVYFVFSLVLVQNLYAYTQPKISAELGSQIYDIIVADELTHYLLFDAPIERVGTVPRNISIKVIDQHMWIEVEKIPSAQLHLHVITASGNWVINLSPISSSHQDKSRQTASQTDHVLQSRKTHSVPIVNYANIIDVIQKYLYSGGKGFTPVDESQTNFSNRLLQCSQLAPLQCSSLVRTELIGIWKQFQPDTGEVYYFWMMNVSLDPLGYSFQDNGNLAQSISLDVSSVRGDWLACVFQYNELSSSRLSVKLMLISNTVSPAIF